MIAKKALGKGLGKGLDAFMNLSRPDLTNEYSIGEIEISKVFPNPNQPRKIFDEESISLLSSSIKQHGVIQPIIVKEVDDGYMIIAGERRFKAAKLAELKSIPAILADYDEVTISKISLVENLQREDLNPVEEANAYVQLMEEYGMTQENVAEAVGKSRSHIANTMRLLKLTDHVLDMLIVGKLTSGHCRAILRLGDEDQRYVADTILREGMNVRDVENLVQKMADLKINSSNDTSNDKKTESIENLNHVEKGKIPEIKSIENRLEELLSTKVYIKGGKNNGKITIDFYGYEDLDRILKLLL